MRLAKESRMPLPTETVYCPDLVVTEILRTAPSIVSQASRLPVFQAPGSGGAQ